jgi:hypothetical protein
MSFLDIFAGAVEEMYTSRINISTNLDIAMMRHFASFSEILGRAMTG